MNDFFDSLKEIKKEMVKEKVLTQNKSLSKEEAIAKKEKKLRDEFLAYTKHANINKDKLS